MHIRVSPNRSYYLSYGIGGASITGGERQTVAVLLDVNAGGQSAVIPVEGVLKVNYIDHLNAVRTRLDFAHLKLG